MNLNRVLCIIAALIIAILYVACGVAVVLWQMRMISSSKFITQDGARKIEDKIKDIEKEMIPETM